MSPVFFFSFHLLYPDSPNRATSYYFLAVGQIKEMQCPRRLHHSMTQTLVPKVEFLYRVTVVHENFCVLLGPVDPDGDIFTVGRHCVVTSQPPRICEIRDVLTES